MISHTISQMTAQGSPAAAARTTPRHEREQPQETFLPAAGEWIGSHPLLCVGAAMAIGATIGCLIKRT